jgi:hypothetical protein
MKASNEKINTKIQYQEIEMCFAAADDDNNNTAPWL